MKKKLLIFILVLVMALIFVPCIASAANTTEFAGGSGTAKDPYLISTKTHLNNVRKYLDAHFKLKCDIVFTNADFAKGGAFYNKGAGWQPIGADYDSAFFSGTFDGNGFAVKNLHINISGGSGDIYVGLFGVNNGTIQNLGMVGGKVSATTKRIGYIGGIAGYNFVGTIKNCYNTGTVSATATKSSGYVPARAYVGGIAGYNNYIITACYNTGKISATAKSSYAAYAGGIVGYNHRTITNCYNASNVSATAYSEYSYAYAGGIAGYNHSHSTITGCYNTAKVSATAKQYAYGGGIVGENEDAVTDCYNTGDISADKYAGGIVGCNSGERDSTTIKNCYNTGDVSADKYAGGITGDGDTITGCYNTGAITACSAPAYAGGIAGICDTIEDCYNTGNVSVTAKSSFACAGGIVGDAGDTIDSCYNTGNVSATAEGHAYVGGIAGYNNYSICTITGCYNTGNVSATAEEYAYAGGIAGKIYECTITNCYNTGKVSATATSPVSYSKAYVGGIIGCNDYSTIKNCYYLDTISVGVGEGTDNTTQCTAKQMRTKSTFVGFDFSTIWDINANSEYKYPVLNSIHPYKTVTATLSTASYTYNGKAKTPAVTVKNSAGKTLTKNVDYTVTYASGRINAGTYKVTIKGKGSYSFTKTLTFKINPAKASNCAMKLSTYTYTYDGKMKAPTVKITSPTGSTLTKGTHYTVTYASGRRNAGTYKVTVTMKGNYTGTKTQSFKINPIKVTNCSVKLSTTAYTYNGKVKTPTVKVVSPTGSTLTKGSSYTVTYASGRKNVGTYKVTVKMKGNYTGTKTLTFKISPPATTIAKLTAGSKSITVGIAKKTSQVTGYQIQYSTSKTFSSATTKTISSYKTSSYALKGLSARKTYFVRVRTYKTVNNTKYYSGWSTYKYVKTK